MRLPVPRCALTADLFEALSSGDASRLPVGASVPTYDDPVSDDGAQLALWVCYELHYRGFEQVSDSWEWHPSVLALRSALEHQFLHALTSHVSIPAGEGSVTERLWELVQNDAGASPSAYLLRDGTRGQFREFVQHRSVYQLKEADPHTWAIPRLAGRSKAALVEIQMDEYGNGDPARMHSTLFARVLRYFDVDDDYGAHVDVAPGVTLALTNLISMFGLHRRWRGALAGHLAAFEMNSSEPSRRLARALRNLGGDDEACSFYDVHVTADALHEQVAAYDLCGTLAKDEPALADDILFGAAAGLHVESLFAEHVLSRWESGLSSLRARDRMPLRC